MKFLTKIVWISQDTSLILFIILNCYRTTHYEAHDTGELEVGGR